MENSCLHQFMYKDILREQKEIKLKGILYHQTQVSFAYNTNYIEWSTLLMDWYNSLKQVTAKEINEFHYRFESIHPF